jgi:hypothetical protein
MEQAKKQTNFVLSSFTALALKRGVIDFVVIWIRAVVMVMKGHSLHCD